jgi:hypothetical protein
MRYSAVLAALLSLLLSLFAGCDDPPPTPPPHPAGSGTITISVKDHPEQSIEARWSCDGQGLWTLDVDGASNTAIVFLDSSGNPLGHCGGNGTHTEGTEPPGTATAGLGAKKDGKTYGGRIPQSDA